MRHLKVFYFTFITLVYLFIVTGAVFPTLDLLSQVSSR